MCEYTFFSGKQQYFFSDLFEQNENEKKTTTNFYLVKWNNDGKNELRTRFAYTLIQLDELEYCMIL